MKPDEIPQENAPPQAKEFILGPPADPASPSERFYANAIRRTHLAIATLGLVIVMLGAFRYGPRTALGLALGTVLSWWNFRSLVSAVTGLAGRVVEQGQSASGGAIVFRFIVRIPLVALAGYAIFISSPGSLRGFLVGLCVPVAALLFEAGYEAFTTLRRGF